MPCPKSATVNGQQTVPGPQRRVCVNLICCRLAKKVSERGFREQLWEQEARRSHLSVGVMANAALDGVTSLGRLMNFTAE